MSIRFNADKVGLRRTTNLPDAHSAFTICGFAKLDAGSASRDAHIVYTQTTIGDHAETLFLTGASGNTLRGADSYGTTSTADVATVSSGSADGEGWFFFALVGLASGAGGLRAYHKPVGSGSLTYQATTNSPGTAGFESIMFGDVPFGTTYWLDGYLAYLKVYNRALSDAELESEASQGAPVSSTGLISYHSFSNATIGVAVVPDTGTGTFSYYTSAPSTSTDMPDFGAVPTLTLSDTLPSVSTPVPPGASAPTLTTASALTSRTVAAIWAPPSGTVDGYRLYAQRVGSPRFLIGTAASGVYTTTGSGMAPATAYSITVASYNSVGESSPSNAVQVTTKRLKIRMPKVRKTIAGTAGTRMVVFEEPTGSDITGEKICETTAVVIGTATLDAVEGDLVCEVVGDLSGLTTLALAEDDEVRACIVDSTNALSTAIRTATVFEE